MSIPPNTACAVRAGTALDLQKGLKICNAAVAAEPKNYVLANRGLVKLELGDWAGARADFDRALAGSALFGGFRARALYGRGVARLKLGDSAGGADMQRAAKQSPYIAADFAALGITR